MDVDGTLTDGKIYMGTEGELMKAFDVKDGCGIKEMLPKHGIIPVIITARESDILWNRCQELGITELHQGVRDKLGCLENILRRFSSDFSEVAYVGDDILDLQCMVPVTKHGGLAACPQDAVTVVSECCNYVSPFPAGRGAVRDIIEHIVANQSKTEDKRSGRLEWAIDYIKTLDWERLELGRHDVEEGFYFNVIDYCPGQEDDVLYESHRKYIDIQRIVSGMEKLMVTDVMRLTPVTTYNEEQDYVNYTGKINKSGIILCPESCVVLYPKDAHKAVCFKSGVRVKKIVGKLLVENA